MANLQIKGIDEGLYTQLKHLASSQNRSVSQEVLFLIKSHLARGGAEQQIRTSAQVLLDLAGSWEDDRSADMIIEDLKKFRKPSRKLRRGF